MRFVNVQSLLKVVGSQLESLTLEVDEEQGKGSELVFIAKTCSSLKSLRILIGDKTLMFSVHPTEYSPNFHSLFIFQVYHQLCHDENDNN